MSIRKSLAAVWWVLAPLLGAFVVLFCVAVLDGSSPLPETVTRIIGSLLALGVMLLLSRFLYKRGLRLYGVKRQGFVRDTLSGFALGALMVGTVVVVMVLAGWYKVEGVNLSASIIFGSLELMILVGIYEEFLFRSLAFAPLEAKVGTWAALGISALLFGAAHLTNSGATLLSTFITAVAGIFLTVAFVAARNIWLPIGMHASWNFFLMMFGLTVSGQDVPTPVVAAITGPELWVGGSYGPESGLIVLIVLLFTVAGLGWWALRRNSLVRPDEVKDEVETVADARADF